MKLSLEQVEYIADLARLELTVKEKKVFTEQLSSILEYAAELEMLDTDSVLPMEYIHFLNKLRGE